MGKRMTPLEELGSHVANSLEGAREKNNAGARVRRRLGEVGGRASRESRGIGGPLRLRRGAVLGLGGLAAAAVLGAVAVSVRPPSEKAPLTFAVGAVGSPDAAAGGGEVGAFLAAPATADLPLSFSDGTSLRLAAGSHARISDVTANGARVFLEGGVVHANVVHRAGTRWRVDAGPFEVAVTGTQFDVAWEPSDEALVVTLHEGSVVVKGCGVAKTPEGQRVSAGQELRASCKRGTSTLGLIASDEPHVRPQTTSANLPPVPSATPAPEGRGASGAPAATPAFTAPSASDLMARAHARRYGARGDDANDLFLEVRRRFSGTDEAALAAFELGRLAFDAQQDFEAASRWFDTYLRERPAGALAREALGRSLEARQREGDMSGAREMAARYLVAYPDGPHATFARRLTRGADHEGASP